MYSLILTVNIIKDKDSDTHQKHYYCHISNLNTLDIG